MIKSRCGSSAGNAGELQVAEELRAGELCTELCAAWATGVGLWSQLGPGAGEVRTSNWALPSSFSFFSTFRGLTGGMKWKLNLI